MTQFLRRRSLSRRIGAALVPLLFIAIPARAVTPAERNALMAIYNATGGPQWTTNTGWGGVEGTECNWTKINCDANGSVVNLFLGTNNLVGTIPAAIGDLPKLQRLYMNDNKLRGTIPPEIGSLTQLIELGLATNQLSGPIPPQIGSLTNLRFLFLGTNALDGPIPATIGNLTNLQDLFLNANQLGGPIPDLSRLTGLAKLYLRANKLTGSIPPDIGRLTNLKELILDVNQLSGPIPSLGTLQKLERLNLGQNQLTGPIPADIGSLASLTELSLYTNQLSGPIPLQLGALANLKFLYLCCNQFDGPIPASLGGLTSLQEMFLHSNRLTGEIPDLSRLTGLTKLNLSTNKLTGPIPPLGTLSKLKELILNTNELGGPIPSLAALQSLEKLYLGQNRLNGAIPDLGLLANLSELSLYNNQLSGNLPALGTLTNLRIVFLDVNQLSGSIPSLAGLRKLEILNLSTNQLSGTIPPDLGSLPTLQRIYLASNSLSGPIPNLAGLSQLRTLQLGSNQLSGEIPPSLTDLIALEDLRLNRNQLSGPIPDGIGRLVNLTVLDLSYNQLSGPVPASITNLSKLRELFLTKNGLTGVFLSDIAKLTSLVILAVAENQLEGSFPSDLGRIRGLKQIFLYSNRFGGPLPESLGDLAELTDLQAGANQFSGPIPASLGKLTRLQKLHLNRNQLSGAIPATLGNLTGLTELSVYSNQLTGTIPPELGRLVNLTVLTMGANGLTGQIPSELGTLSKLRDLNLYSNRLSGPIPASIGDLAALEILGLATNSLDGRIPPQLGRLSKLKQLHLAANRLEGAIPRELGGLTLLEKLTLDANQLTGTIPAELANLQRLVTLSLRFNGLTSTDTALNAFLARLQPDWLDFQNIPPTDVRVAGIDATTAVLSWRTVPGKTGAGGYQIALASPPGTPLAVQQTTAGKWISSVIVSGLTPATEYSFAVRSVAYPNLGSNIDRPFQQNTLVSDYAPILTARTSPSGAEVPNIVAFSLPAGPIIRGLGVDRNERYVLTNIGRRRTTITITQSAPFFTQSPTSFTLDPGASRTVTLTGTEQAPGVYEGTSTPSGDGVPSGLTIPVSMLMLAFGSSNVVAVPSAMRIDLSTETNGTVDFTNTGSDTLFGVLISDADWIEPQTRGLIEIRPGQRVTLRFNVNRARRPVADGSLTGGLYLVYPKTAAGALLMLTDPLGSHTSLGVTTVSVVDTPRPPVSPGGPPPLAAGEVALFIPGIGTVRGANARYISDINLVNASGASALTNTRLYYIPETAQNPAARADLPPLPPNSLVSYGNIITSVFQSESTGTLQIRVSGSIDHLTASARIFNIEGRNGTFGTAIPVFRSDRGAAAGEEIVLAGVRKDANTRTNLFVQEMSGFPARFDIRFLDRNGAQLGSYSGDVNAFSLRRVLDQVPTGALTAVITNARDSAGRIAAYATPLDTRSSDFWSVVEWSRHFGFDRSEQSVIPIAGSVRGAGNKFFRSDLTISNRSPVPRKGTLRFVSRSAPTIDSVIDLPAGGTLSVDDLLGQYFRLTSGDGYLVFAPQCESADESLGPEACDAAFSLASRNFATEGDDPGTYGTAVPALPLASALRAGQSRLIGGIEDVAISRGPGSYRTNFSLLEVSGAPVTVRVTVIKPQTTGSLSFLTGASMDVTLGPYEQTPIRNVSTTILGSGNEIRNGSLLVRVLSGEGAVLVFTSSLDNGTGDAVLRVE